MYFIAFGEPLARRSMTRIERYKALGLRDLFGLPPEPYVPLRLIPVEQAALIVTMVKVAIKGGADASIPSPLTRQVSMPPDSSAGADVDGNRPASEDKLLVTVAEAAKRLSIGRPKMWELVMRGEVLSFKIGASRRIPVTALDDYVARLSMSAAEHAPVGISPHTTHTTSETTAKERSVIA